ncbi:hypothetical protein SI65_10204 [Aspergillus cristatus]|uniref:CREG-like beta-barrel domain-containing protein n=1 Tax=Aspergillus cristatus TaxID=573508 RepID=A0A1E3B0C5_ASPCR|nr:hypothetical protein SI65_10204 [Aspergillus cristatus]
MKSLLLLCCQLLAVFATPLVLPDDALVEQAFLSDAQGASALPATNSHQDAIYIDHSSSSGRQVEPMIRPSWFTSVLMARRLLALSTSGVASTIFPSSLPPNGHTPPSVAGHSISLREYFADCDEALPSSYKYANNGDGNPTLLALKVATTFRNTAAGSNISLSLDWWDHINDTEPIYPGFPLSPAGLPRVTLFGYVEPFPEPIPEDVETALEKCYLRAHPDAEVWLPHKRGSPHSSFWARMVVTDVYWIGGFGDVQQIGWMDVKEWAGVRRKGSVEGVGDGRGWEDVRLPGEKQ